MMSENPLISIAIPTYNRVKYLEECLNSITSQFNEKLYNEIAIFIFDNASTDETKHMINTKYSKFKNIYYSCNEFNKGADKNFYRCFYETQGDFIFLMSDDDILLPGALMKIYNFIINHNDATLIHLNSRTFELDYSFDKLSDPRLKTKNDIIMYSKDDFINKVNIWITFASTMIYNRKHVINKEKSKEFFGSFFIHSHISLLSSKENNQKFSILAYPCIGVRGGNSGGFKFYYVWCYSFKRLLFNTGREAGYDMKLMKKLYIDSWCSNLRNTLLSIKLGTNSYEIDSIFILLKNTWMYPKIYIHVYPIAFLPSRVLKILKLIKNIIYK